MYTYKCLIDTSAIGEVHKTDKKKLNYIVEDAAAHIAAKINHTDPEYYYIDEEDKEECVNNVMICGADNPDEIISLIKNWKSKNDNKIRELIDKLESKYNKDNKENNSTALIDSFTSICITDYTYSYNLRNALRCREGIFEIDDEKCIIDRDDDIDSGCAEYQYKNALKEITEHPECWIYIEVPYYD